MPQQVLQDNQGQTHAGLAVSGGREAELHQAAQVLDRGIAVENLQNKELEGENRPQLAFPPAMAGLTTGLLDQGVGQMRLEILLDSPQSACDSSHPWPPVKWLS